MTKKITISLFAVMAMLGVGVSYKILVASDHDDGENDMKSRALNLTDHYAFVDTVDATKLDLVQTSNPRSLAGFQYFFSTQARYEIHVSRVTNKAAVPTGSDDVVLRFEFGAPDSTNTQSIKLTLVKAGVEVGSTTGSTTNLTKSTNNSAPVINTATIAGVPVRYFAGLREDTFHFDVQRFFEVRAFLASTFYGGQVATTPLNDFQVKHKTCDGNYFLKGFPGFDTIGGGALATYSPSNGDPVHLFNPPGCAEDFTKLYNRNEIEVQIPISALQTSGQTTFDTWSTISIPE